MIKKVIQCGLQFKCGNSSGVEHNLAKVGVASSNLVSRSTFFILLLFLPFKMLAVDIYPMYCVDSQFITLKTFGFDGENNEILDMKAHRALKIDTQTLSKILTSNFKSFIDKSGGNVAFIRNCTNLDSLQEGFLKTLSDLHQGISVKSLTIEPQNLLPQDFDSYKFKELVLNEAIKSSGVFRAVFEQSDFSTKSLFFKYSFDAKMPVFMALNSMQPKHVLSALDYTSSFVEFNKFNKNSLSKIEPRLIVKTPIKHGEILMDRYFLKDTLVKKGDTLNAIISEDGVNIIIKAKALENANLGEIINIRTKDNKTYKAMISSKKEVIIR